MCKNTGTSFYEPAAPKKKPPWLWIILGSAIVLVLLAGSVLLFFVPHKTPKAGLSTTELGKALIGEPMHWRVLARGGMLYDMRGGILEGNFDDDDAEELLFIGSNRARFYNIDCSSKKVALRGELYASGLTAWDYEGDGEDEIVPDPVLVTLLGFGTTVDPTNNKTVAQTPVYNIRGEKLTDLRGTAGWARFPLVGDMGGAGYRSLLLDKDATSNTAYGKFGKELRSIPGRQTRGDLIALADVLGEGRCCLVTLENRGRNLMAFDRLNKAHFLGSIKEQPECLYTASDIDRDKRQDIIFGSLGYYNIKRGWIPFKYKTKPAATFDIPAVTAEILANGERQIALVSTGSDAVKVKDAKAKAAKQGDAIANELLLFDKDGKVVHQERFAKEILGLARLRTSKQEYLCLQFSDQILIYP